MRSTRTFDRYATSPMRPPALCAILRSMDAVEVESRERVHIRVRENASTLAAWRVSLRAPRGAIVLAEAGGKSWYRGEGDLLEVPQERRPALRKASLQSYTGPEWRHY